MAEILEHSNCEPYTSWYLKKKIIERFGDDVIIAEIDGRPDVITMRPTVAKILYNFYYEPKEDSTRREEIRLVKAAATMIKNDIKRHDGSKETYPLSSDMSSVETAIYFLPESLIPLLDTLIIGVDKKLEIASIGQAIMQAARLRGLISPLQQGLAVQMHHHFGSRFLIDSFHRHGFCSSYSEVQMFERNAAVASGTELNIPDGDCLVQYVADNVDHNIRTIDGKNTFHGMGIIATITPRNTDSQTYSVISRRKTITSEEIANIGQINTHQYKPPLDRCRSIYEDMIYTTVYDFTSNVDFLWKSSWLLKPDRPGWSGFMQFCQKGEYPGKSDIVFLPMIDLNPSDLTCIYLTINFVSRHSRKYGVVPILTFDQPLWWKAMCIVNDEPPESDLKRVVLRLRAFHIQMSFYREHWAYNERIRTAGSSRTDLCQQCS